MGMAGRGGGGTLWSRPKRATRTALFFFYILCILSIVWCDRRCAQWERHIPCPPLRFTYCRRNGARQRSCGLRPQQRNSLCAALPPRPPDVAIYPLSFSLGAPIPIRVARRLPGAGMRLVGVPATPHPNWLSGKGHCLAVGAIGSRPGREPGAPSPLVHTSDVFRSR